MNHIKAFFQPAIALFNEKVIDTEAHAYLANLCTEAKIAIDAIGAKHPKNKALKVAAGTLSLTAVIDIPVTAYELTKTVNNLAKAKNRPEKTDHCLTIASLISQLADDALAICSGLQGLKAIASPMRWLPPVAIASAVLSTANFAIEGRNLYYLEKMGAKLKKEKYRNAPAQLVEKHSYRMKTYCAIDPELVKKTIETNPAKAEACREEIQRRIKFRKATQALSIVIAAVSLIATVILLASPIGPLALVATALFAGMTALSMARRGANFYADQSFKKRLTALTA